VKRSVVLSIAVVIAITFPHLWPVAGTAGDDKGKATDEAAIRKVIDDGVKAFNQHDVKALAKTFHSDADFTNVIGWTAHGRDEIEAFHKPLLADKQPQGAAWFGKAALKNDGEPVIRFLRPDVATADGRWIMTGALLPDGKELPERKGLAMYMLTKEKGVWGIAAFHNLEIDPAIPKNAPKAP
jgi:uncharacterized protein (TIGR02246 family)